MSARYELLNDGAGVIIDCFGNLVSEDIFAVNRAIDKDPLASKAGYYLIDLSDLDSLEISAENLLKIANADNARLQSRPSVKFAFVTNHDVVRSVVFMWCGYIGLGDQCVRQFPTREQAFEWLGEKHPQGLVESP